ncbi:DUF4241 domain-containing protein [Promicromonospora iranensis]|uniref:DUF4241 domain-containing protein n=1 Tax=Promicromonospora iranensis TaxID=1105144 RepID=A0ABU2CV99_9MICO|nr:DUF4241 domain-containing protein [Promicromonospora iranensis]MDR7385269.1 hypothetical protein [Promicromonospora iranensis]
MSYFRPLFALLPGTPDGTSHPQTVHELGVLHVRSGRVEASDPYVSLGDGLVTAVPPGSYPVRVTVADVSEERDGSHEREAYLSLVVSDAAPVAEVRLVSPEGAEPSGDGKFYGVGVAAGTVAFADPEAVAAYMPPQEDEWYDGVFDNDSGSSWFARQDDPAHYRNGCANVTLPLATDGENVVLSHSGWGDGFYPVVTTHDADGALLGVHIDLLVAGPDEPEDEEDEEAPVTVRA